MCMQDAEEKGLSNTLVQALTPAVRLELLPKSAIDVYITVLENDGTSSCLAAAIIAASTALADAGIEMLDQVTACSAVSHIERNGRSSQPLIDTIFHLVVCQGPDCHGWNRK